MSYMPMFCVQGNWCGNAQRFATRGEAEESAKDRFMGYILITSETVVTTPSEWRVDESSDPVNFQRVNGTDYSLFLNAKVTG